MKRNKTKQVLACVLSILAVAGFTVPANVGTGGNTGGTAIVSNAADTITASVDTTSSYKPTQIVNGDFESKMNGAVMPDTNTGNTNGNYDGVGWGTTDKCFELFSTSTYGVAYRAGLVAELNAWNASVLYQDLQTYSNDVIMWTLDHAARTGLTGAQTVEVHIGASDGNNPSGTNSNINVHINPNTLAKFSSAEVTNPNGKTLGYATSSDLSGLSVTANGTNSNPWYTARGVYVIPEGQTKTRFAFTSTYAVSPGSGNILDNITFSTLIGNLNAVESDNNVVITGYWGDTNSSKKLKIDAGSNTISVDMTNVLKKNFKITLPVSQLGGASKVTVYHEDYKDAGRTADILCDISSSNITVDSILAQTYTGNALTPKITIKDTYKNNAVLTESTDYTISYSNNVNAGTATITITGKGNYTGTKTANFTINPKEIGINWTNTTLTYNGSKQKPTATATGLCDGDTCDITVTGEQTNAGKYTATASSLNNNNYKLPAATTTDFVINPKEIGIAWGDAEFTYDKNSHAPTATATGLCDGDTCNITVTGEQTNAGNYTAVAESLNNNNYKLPATNTKEFTINKANISPNVTMNGWTYGEIANTPTVTGNDGNGEVTYSYTGTTNAGENYSSNNAPTQAGNYTVTATIAETDNYNDGTASADFTIKRADYTPTVNIIGWIYKENNETNLPSVTENPENGEVTYEYAPKGTNNWSSEIPVQDGVYTVKATIAQTANYNQQIATTDFEIKLKEGFVHIGDTIPTKEGSLFAGFFTDNTCVTPYLDDDVAFAKFVDAETYLNLTSRVNDPVFSADGKKADLTFSVLAPDTNFQNVRFEIEVAGKTKKVQIDRLVKTENGCQASYTLKGVLKKYFGKKITITPYWTTLDGTTVTGTATTYTIQ